MDFAREFSLALQIIEKDYVLGWLLAGIAAHPALKDSWVFKGGTCLKKCYFGTYRFSEDLDFTLTNSDHLREDFLLETFGRIAEWITEQSGIEMPPETLRFEIYENPRNMISAQGRVGYRGPMRRGGIVQKLWNYCNVLLDDGMHYSDYVEQLTYFLFLKMADWRYRRLRPEFSYPFARSVEQFAW